MSLTTKSFSVKHFSDLVTRTLRQVEIKLNFTPDSENSDVADDFLNNVFENFHSFYRQLMNRHANRTSIEIKDEYDVQDLFHAILKLKFNDIREEEYTPSYAGSSTRVDFLLKNENIVIEIKKTRDRLADKEVGEQLILDVTHYKNHPNCKKLKCFVYDPESRIKNPRGLEGDLKRLSDENMSVELYIRP
jgi:REase_DpnII-MboI